MLELLRVVTIGPECTGKTWLAREVASRYGAPSSEEYARLFVEKHPRPVVYTDVSAIGEGQVRLEDEAVALARQTGSRLVIHDTDLVSTAVYSRHYYGDCPAWIEPAALSRLADLYLLHHIDVPWVDEGFQRAAPERRAELFARFRDTLAALDADAALITGDWEARRHLAMAAIDALLAK